MWNSKENGKILTENARKSNFEKNACQNTIAMETSNYLLQDLSYDIVAK